MKNTDQIIEEAIESIEYNSHDMGEIGNFIRVEYVQPILEKALTAQREEFNAVVNRIGTNTGVGTEVQQELASIVNASLDIIRDHFIKELEV